MPLKDATLIEFTIAPPPFVSSQSQLLGWIIAAHTQAESNTKEHWTAEERYLFADELAQKLAHVGCKSGTIDKRAHVIADFQHEEWQQMQVYRLEDAPSGVEMQERQRIHQQTVDIFFTHLYQNEMSVPSDMIHVCCTGYASPSGAQKLISKKGWGDQSVATHLYHMGCYGSIPAIRLGKAFCKDGRLKTDIVHTELCTLHMNPLDHSASQLVSQSLFADGCIKYSVVSRQEAIKRKHPFLKILACHEEVIPNSIETMQWVMGNAGFHFVLTKEIPVLIARALEKYLTDLCSKAGLNRTDPAIQEALFAIHPGGPKIIDYAQRVCGFEDPQVQISRQVLKEHGNMSSATLPHIWQKMLADETIKSGTKIISIAFGPGLTIAGALLEKES